MSLPTGFGRSCWRTIALLVLSLSPRATPFAGAADGPSAHVGQIFWQIENREAIVWPVASETRLPHADHLEMSGRRVSAIIDYSVDASRQVTVRREVIYPQLRVFPPTGSPDWFRYRAYLRGHYTDDDLPTLLVNGQQLRPGALETVRIDGMLHLRHQPVEGLVVERTFFPSMTERLLVEQWTVQNTASEPKRLEMLPQRRQRTQAGPEGRYELLVRLAEGQLPDQLPAGESTRFAVYFEALAPGEAPATIEPAEVEAQRRDYVTAMKERTRLRSPDPALDTAFLFAKIRAAESVFESRLGLIHSPGGGNYYVGVWANDQAEYSGPFFSYLGYEPASEAALNAYLTFLDHLPQGDGKIFASFEMEGALPCCSKDRGDAAMLAYGAAHYSLCRGDLTVARQLWPLIRWGLDYCQRRLNDAGVVRSDSDEMEGRLPTGTANLSTSSLYYAALRLSAHLAASLGHEQAYVQDLNQRADQLARAIEVYFGASIGGYNTYRYFEGHDALRHWITLPLAMGLTARADETVRALFGPMWTEQGVRVEWRPDGSSPDLFWDRGTLYALRAGLRVGATDQTFEKVQAYTQTRLLGFHVPYAIEAWPENNMRHLSAESALYARIFTEGLLGLEPTGLDSFRLTPRLPSAWAGQGYSLEDVHLQGRRLTLQVESSGPDALKTVVRHGTRILLEEVRPVGSSFDVKLPALR